MAQKEKAEGRKKTMASRRNIFEGGAPKTEKNGSGEKIGKHSGKGVLTRDTNTTEEIWWKR